METIKMTRKEFASKALEKIEKKLLLEGICINEDVDDSGEESLSTRNPRAWEKYVRELLGENNFTQKIIKEITYKNLDGKTCTLNVNPKSEYFDRLQKVSAAKAKNYPELWREMVSLVNEIIDLKGKSKMFELVGIRQRADHTGGRTATTMRVNWLDIDAFNIYGFDSFYNGLCRNIIEYPQEKFRFGYTEPLRFVEKLPSGDNPYKGKLQVVWNYEPLTYTLYGKYTITDVIDDVEDPDPPFTIDIKKVFHPIDDSIKRELSDDRPEITDRLYAEAIRNKSVWFDVYINLMDNVRRILKNKNNIEDIKVLLDTTPDEIINNVNA